MKAVDLVGIQLAAGTGVPVVLLLEQEAPHRVLPVFVGSTEAAAIAMGMGDHEPPRPLTHDLVGHLLRSLDAEVDRVEVSDLGDESAFRADVVLRAPDGDHHVDSRPSDAIALAVRAHAPLFVSDEVLDALGTVVVIDELGEGDAEEQADEAAIDAEVHEFRSFLEDLEPADFAGDDPD